MRYSELSLLLLLVCSVISCDLKNYTYLESEPYNQNTYSESDSGMPNEPGKCYARCLMQDQYEKTLLDSFYYYTGDNYNQKGVDYFERRQEGQVIKEYVVTDTSLVKDWVFDYYYVRQLVKAGGFTEWKEVVCSTAPGYSQLPTKVHDALIREGYELGTLKKTFDSKIKAALIDFQKDNGLPIGQLDVETLDALGVSY